MSVKSNSAINLGYIKEANVEQWPKTMNKLKTKYSKATLIIPGHDEWKVTY
jgi:metallo-beta-lactamase class B IND